MEKIDGLTEKFLQAFGCATFSLDVMQECASVLKGLSLKGIPDAEQGAVNQVKELLQTAANRVDAKLKGMMKGQG